jgi:mannose-1-phosphate guanylyltransferase/mannose-6-phosphate isomerase
LFSKKVFLSELEKHNYEYFDIIKDWVLQNFEKLLDLSIDYWLLEKSDNIKVALLDIYWNDLGWFDAFNEYFLEHNIVNDFIQLESENNLVICNDSEKQICLLWVKDLIVVDTEDALLISKKWETQKVKHVIEKLKDKSKKQLDFWKTVYRPWWSYTIIDEWKLFKTKRLTVLPWKKLSSQLHYHRSEHWVVVSWTAKISLDDSEIILSKWESTFIKIGTKHRLENCGKTDLHIIESQIGDYLEEDDIIRFDDDYWRI